ncbi:MAG: hypothetical protein K8R39_01855 [Arcobacteraceae bacterium]|nr:hypothetical protein [Arcobacteraceae bacterium]
MKNNITLLLITLFVFIGCGDKTKEESTDQNIKTTTPQIEVITNANPKAIKVEEKEKTEIKTKEGKAYYYDYNVESSYDENSRPANKDASVRVKPRTVLDANMHIRSPYERVQISLIVKQLSTNFKLKCSACHDDYANGVIGPSLLGKDAEFIYKSINDFKNGSKSNPLMVDLIKQMTDKDIKDISTEIFLFNKKIEELGARQ